MQWLCEFKWLFRFYTLRLSYLGLCRASPRNSERGRACRNCGLKYWICILMNKSFNCFNLLFVPQEHKMSSQIQNRARGARGPLINCTSFDSWSLIPRARCKGLFWQDCKRAAMQGAFLGSQVSMMTPEQLRMVPAALPAPLE